jgi:hypothetical protein
MNDNNNIDHLLEQEKNDNKTESWNKLNQTTKTEKLHIYAETYGHKKGYNPTQIKKLKAYFSHCLQEKKLSKTKDVHYDKIKQEVIEVHGLQFNNNNFTIRSDTKRVNTIKSLTPKRTTLKDKNNDLKIEN